MKPKLKFKPKFLYNEEGEKKGVILKIEDFEALIEQLEDLKDRYTAHQRTAKKFKPIPFEKIKKEFLDDVQKLS